MGRKTHEKEVKRERGNKGSDPLPVISDQSAKQQKKRSEAIRVILSFESA
jgi:hypothetical protein